MVKILFTALVFVVGLLVGLGSAHVTTITDVRLNTAKIDTMSKSIEANSRTIQSTLDIVETLTRQNTMLINQFIAKHGG